MLPKMPIGAMGWVITMPMMMRCHSVRERRRRGAPGVDGLLPALIRARSHGRCGGSLFRSRTQECRRTLVQAVFVDFLGKHGEARGAEDAGIGAEHSARDSRA